VSHVIVATPANQPTLSAHGRRSACQQEALHPLLDTIVSQLNLPLMMMTASCTRLLAQVVEDVLQAGDGGVIAVDRAGNIAMPFNSEGMYRGCADSRGRFEVAVFHDDVGA
jgi:isoaspartyl peptidase/L-asparaginase-like protein (Ntn-hydrolase superfamily)